MKVLFILLIVFTCVGFPIKTNCITLPGLGSDKTSLSGVITDKATGETLPGVNVYLPDLKTGTVSDDQGEYRIDNLPAAKVTVNVSFVGYKLVAEVVDLSQTSIKNFELEESVVELHEVVVTGLSQSAESNRTPTPISTISPTQLLQNASTNIIDAITMQPGVSAVTSGSGIAKPVIRGLGYNRVVTVNDGIRQEGQQWGDEHGIEIDEFSISKVEILKGPASLSYGSDAIAGVINMLTAPTLPEGSMSANFLANYQTNNGLIGYSANFAGNKHGFIWNLRYSNKEAHAYQNRYDGYVFNSGYQEHTLGGIAGLNKFWGYAHVHFSAYNFVPGIVEGTRDSASGEFLKPVVLDDHTEGFAFATLKDFTSYTSLTPFQKVQHYKAVMNNSFIIGNGSLKTTIGWQQNRRKEFGDILQEGQYGLYFLLNSVNYDFRYIFPEHKNLNLSLGANGMYQASKNRGTEYLVPEYNLFDIGVFAIARKSIGKLDISGGLRFDMRTEDGKALYLNADGEAVSPTYPNAINKFVAFNSTFSAVSGSIGATYQFSEAFFTKLNLSRGFRAPNIGELGANGIHEGTLRYEIGDATLKAEQSLELDYSLGITSSHITAELDIFSNKISNYIFSRKLITADGADSISAGYATYKFASGDANLLGGEFRIDLHPHPLDWLHFENAFSYVQAIQKDQPDSTKYLPFIPAARVTSELKAVQKKIGKGLANAYLKIGVDYYFRQNKYYAAYGTETATPGYTLLNLGVGADVVSHETTLFSFYIVAQNLTDVAYQSHLSRLKYGELNNATGRTGIYNMGRNVSFKLIVPIQFDAASD